jgi:hypothetical protein
MNTCNEAAMLSLSSRAPAISRQRVCLWLVLTRSASVRYLIGRPHLLLAKATNQSQQINPRKGSCLERLAASYLAVAHLSFDLNLSNKELS